MYVRTSPRAAALAAVAALASAVLGLPGGAAAALGSPLSQGDARVLTHIPAPGQPEGIAVDPHDGSFWTGSNRGFADGVLWHHAADGSLLRTYRLTGHSPARHGINGIVLDGDGLVYALDYSGARIVRLDPATGEQEVYATFANLPLCLPGRRRACEPSLMDRPAWPNWGTFDDAGNLYVSDLNQATIWRVPRGGGTAEIWHQSGDYASVYSVNGMQFDADGRLVFMQTLSLLPRTLGRGVVYRITPRADGSAGHRERVAVTGIGDGLAIGSSGRLYLPLSEPLANYVQVVDPDTGRTVRRLPPLPVRNTLSVVVEAPASAAFSGTSLLVTNHALYSRHARNFAVIEIGAGETGLALHYPSVGPLREAGR